MTYEELKKTRPGNKKRIEKYKAEMKKRIYSFKLKELRERTGVTQVELAKKANISQNAISKLENRRMEDVKIGTFLKYVRSLNQPVIFKVGKQKFAF